MNLTPAQLKFTARQLMDHRYPTGIAPVLTGALIYLLATRWVSLLLSLTTTNPITPFWTSCKPLPPPAPLPRSTPLWPVSPRCSSPCPPR